MLTRSAGGDAARSLRTSATWAADGLGSARRGDASQVDEIARGSLRWLVMISLLSRIILTVQSVIFTRGVQDVQSQGLLLLATGVLFVDGLLIVGALRRPGLLTNRWLFIADLALTVIATVLATTLITPGKFLVPGWDAMTGYGWGTVALWTAVRGWRTGAGLLAGTVIGQLCLAALNHAELDTFGIVSVLQRFGVALLVFSVAAAAVGVARRCARATVLAGLDAGRLAERADTLRSMHDTALADLEAVVLVSKRESRPADERLTAVTRRAVEHVASLSGGMVEAAPTTTLKQRLGALIEQFSARGLHVVLVERPRTGMAAHPPDALDALVGCAREALNNVVKHAEVDGATLSVGGSPRCTVVEVIDKGRGFSVDQEGSGFGLAGSIHERIREVGGYAEVSSAPRNGTRVSLTLSIQRGQQPSSPDPATAEIARVWFPLVPLLARALSLSIIAAKVGVVPSQLYVVLGGLFLCHVALICVLLRPGGDRLLRSNALLATDLAVAAGLYLSMAIQPGTILLTPEGEGVWLYIICTVPFWLAARGTPVGVSVLLGSVAVQAVALAIDGVPPASQGWLTALLHVFQVVFTTGYAWLVMHMARHAFLQARAESLRAGRQAERVQVLDQLKSRVLGTWRAIAASGEEASADRGLQIARAAASAMAGDLRVALRDDGTSAASSHLAEQLRVVVGELRRTGLPVELIATELSADPPPDVAAALVEATRLSVRGPAVSGRSVVVRLSGSSVSSEVCLRDTQARPDPCRGADQVMRSAGGRVDFRYLGERGTRTKLLWTAS